MTLNTFNQECEQFTTKRKVHKDDAPELWAEIHNPHRRYRSYRYKNFILVAKKDFIVRFPYAEF